MFQLFKFRVWYKDVSNPTRIWLWIVIELSLVNILRTESWACIQLWDYNSFFSFHNVSSKIYYQFIIHDIHFLTSSLIPTLIFERLCLIILLSAAFLLKEGPDLLFIAASPRAVICDELPDLLLPHPIVCNWAGECLVNEFFCRNHSVSLNAISAHCAESFDVYSPWHHYVVDILMLRLTPQ